MYHTGQSLRKPSWPHLNNIYLYIGSLHGTKGTFSTPCTSFSSPMLSPRVRPDPGVKSITKGYLLWET